MKTSPLISVIALLACAGLGYYCWRQQGEISDLTTRNATLSAQIAAEDAARREKGGTGMAPTTPGADGKKGETVASTVGQNSKDDGKKENASPAELLAKMMEDPGTRDVMAQQMKEAIKGQYKDLFDLLDLPDDKRAALEKILTDLGAQHQALGMKFFTQKLTAEEKAKLTQQLKDVKTAADESIKAALGDPAKFEQYESFQDSAGERQAVSMVRDALEKESPEMAMSEEQEQQLLSTLYSERKAMNFTYDYTDQYDASPEKFSSEAIDSYLEQTKVLDQRVEEKTATILRPEQLEIYRTQRTSLRNMEKMGLTMAKTMFGQSEGGE